MPSSEHECDDEPTSAEPLLEIYYEATTAPPHRRNPSSRKCQALTSTVLFILGVVSLSLWILRGEIQKSKTHGVCQQPAVRREWRTLSTTERFQYLRAVKCLSSIPSTISKGTLHDEFAYIHQQVGDYCRL
jgi:tyrosinase